MQIYISKNNQQFGPFDQKKVLEMLRNGQFSADDMAIRQGDSQWQKLGNYFPSSLNYAAPVVSLPVASSAPAPAKKSRKGLMLGCLGFLFVGVLATAILGFLGYRNVRPQDSTESLPDIVKTPINGNFKLLSRNPPRGNVWGTEQYFAGVYQNETKTGSVIYLATVYPDRATAEKEFQDAINSSCQAGEKPMYFSFRLDNGSELSQGGTCAAPLYIQNANKVIAIGGAGDAVESWIEFAENLPFNAGTSMKRKS